IFYKWNNDELKKGSRLIIRPGQDAIFLYQGKIEGIFTEDGDYDIESKIIPFLSTLAGFKFGFNSGLRAEVLFVNTRDFTVPWGTQNAINLPVAGLPGGMPIRAYGTFICSVTDYTVLVEKVAGVKSKYTIDDVRQRLISVTDQFLMKYIVKDGKDMFNIQANAPEIGEDIAKAIDGKLADIGMTCTDFQIQSVSYPDNVREMQEKAAGAAMVGDATHYTQVQMANSLENGGNGGGNTASQMAQMAMGMAMGQQMAGAMTGTAAPQAAAAAPAASAPIASDGKAPNFCPNCGTPTNGAKFCSNCGQQLY
ncbi:MAG: SPFH domain-containing protein, partial [Lachnospiraceae bacterium]|nr:SPFH domain-containing protein [Lachnospiraceae bacterium]